MDINITPLDIKMFHFNPKIDTFQKIISSKSMIL